MSTAVSLPLVHFAATEAASLQPETALPRWSTNGRAGGLSLVWPASGAVFGYSEGGDVKKLISLLAPVHALDTCRGWLAVGSGKSALLYRAAGKKDEWVLASVAQCDAAVCHIVVLPTASSEDCVFFVVVTASGQVSVLGLQADTAGKLFKSRQLATAQAHLTPQCVVCFPARVSGNTVTATLAICAAGAVQLLGLRYVAIGAAESAAVSAQGPPLLLQSGGAAAPVLCAATAQSSGGEFLYISTSKTVYRIEISSAAVAVADPSSLAALLGGSGDEEATAPFGGCVPLPLLMCPTPLTAGSLALTPSSGEVAVYAAGPDGASAWVPLPDWGWSPVETTNSHSLTEQGEEGGAWRDSPPALAAVPPLASEEEEVAEGADILPEDAPEPDCLTVLPVRTPADDCFLVAAAPPPLAGAASRGGSATAPLSLEARRRAGGGTSSSSGDKHVMIHARIKSSGYGAAAPRRPPWTATRGGGAAGGATRGSAASAASSKRLANLRDARRRVGGLDEEASVAPEYPYLIDEGFWGPPSAAAPGAAGGSGAGGSAAKAPPASSASFAVGAVAAIALPKDGTLLAVGGQSGGLVSSSLTSGSGEGGTEEVTVVSGTLTRHYPPVPAAVAGAGSTGSSSKSGSGALTASAVSASLPLSSLTWSAFAYPGLVTRLVAAPPKASASAARGPAALAAAITGGGSSTATKPAASSTNSAARVVDTRGEARLLLGTGGNGSLSGPTAVVWAGASGRSEPVLVLRNSVKGDMSSGGTSASSESNPCLTGSMLGGSFYYQDKFIALGVGSTVYVYTYALDCGESTDGEGKGGLEEDAARLKRRGRNGSAYARAAWWAGAPEGSSLSALACHNEFKSNLLFTASSRDRLVHVYDAGCGGGVAEACRVATGHERPVHTIALAGAAAGNAAVTPASLDCFATAACDGVVKFWDLRACSGSRAKPVRTFSGGHTNRVHAVGVAICPQVRYLAVGSEDNGVGVYDIRGGSGCVAKLGGFTDTVTAVAWVPAAAGGGGGPLTASVTATAGLLAGALDGTCRYFV